MRILQLTPGTGNFYCGACMRDNALVRGLRARGHDVLMVPLYLPLVTDDEPATENAPIFLSGLSVYLANKFPVPSWLNRVLSSPVLLQQAARLTSLTRAKDLGVAAVEMLRGESREIDRLLAWLRTQPDFDVVCLSNSLLSGLAKHFSVPVVCTLQGEDGFLDGLPEPYRSQAWNLLAQRCAYIRQFIAVSQSHGDRMRDRLKIPAVQVVHPGIAVEEFPVGAPTAPVIGYLARMHPSKGLDLLAEAFLQVKTPGARLRIAGALTGSDRRFVRSIRQKLGNRAEFFPNLDRIAKSDFFRQLAVFSVPARSDEAFGLYVLEAMAHSVPVVQPRHGAFPEIFAATGGGILCEPDNPAALAAGLDELLSNPRQYGVAGRQAVAEKFSVDAMSRKVETILQEVIHAR
ncbi:MAG: glycosyltransferase family 4 protein [Verrucomicrobiota bacterium]